MARRYGRAPCSERCRLSVPLGHRKTTVTAALRTTGLLATALFEGATNGERFRDYVVGTLVPVLKPGDTVMLDNLCVCKVAGVREAVEAAGAHLLFFLPYSSDCNPIEQAFARLKALLRSAAARTIPETCGPLSGRPSRASQQTNAATISPQQDTTPMLQPDRWQR